jgi:hypothetical protein
VEIMDQREQDAQDHFNPLPVPRNDVLDARLRKWVAAHRRRWRPPFWKRWLGRAA